MEPPPPGRGASRCSTAHWRCSRRRAELRARRRSWPRSAKRRMLQARFAEAEEAARHAPRHRAGGGRPRVRGPSPQRARGEHRRTGRRGRRRGLPAGGARDRPRRGPAARRRARRGSTSPTCSTSAEARARLSRWRARACAPARPTARARLDWFGLAVAEFSFHLGDWREAEAQIPSPSRRHAGPTLAYWFARAQHARPGPRRPGRRRRRLEGLDARHARVHRAAVRRPLRDLRRRAGASPRRPRAGPDAVDKALDQIEFCSDDFIRITALSAAGVRVEGDAGQLARDHRDAEAQRVVAAGQRT